MSCVLGTSVFGMRGRLGRYWVGMSGDFEYGGYREAELEEGAPSFGDTFGGALLLLIGVGGLGISVAFWPDAVLVAAAGLVSLGLCWAGARTVVRARRMADQTGKRVGSAGFTELIRSRDLGFYVCTRCNTIGDCDWGNGCMRCGSAAEFLPVTDESERRTAIAAVVED